MISDVGHRLPETTCPWCGHHLDGASGMDTDDRPSPGDFGVCIECGGVLVYGDDLTLRRAAEAEWQSQPEPQPTEIRAARRAIREMHSRR